MRYPFPMPSRENWPYLGLLSFMCLVAALWQGAGAAALLGLLGLGVYMLMFQDDARDIPAQSGVVLCPADGRIVRIEKARDPYANRDALRISVFMSLFKAHAN